ncbi:MAG: lipocalin family protein [Solirubrobacterales bacterium]
MKISGRAGFLVSSAIVASVTLAGAPAPAGAQTFADAYYSKDAVVPQSRSAAGMRRYLSSDQKQMEMQSQVFFGNLITRDGKFNSFASMIQRQDGLVKQVPGLPISLSTVLLNSGKGWLGGVIDGVPELTFPMSLTTNPWSARAESVAFGQLPKFVDMRVVDGQLGERGAVYEITASLASSYDSGSTATEQETAYVRVKDMTGIAMWGFGPSGFKPQWLNPGQRSKVMNQYGGSIERYLRATGDPITGQGNYYYSSPLLKVQKFVFYRSGKRILSGNGGYMFFDQCTQTFGAEAQKILGNNFGWVSFEIPIPALGGGMVLGKFSRPDAPALPYAALATTRSPKARNGALVAHNWGLKDISLEPVASSAWKSPESGKTYYLKWRAVLKGPDAAHRGNLTLTAVHKDSEVNFDGRAVYEGLFRYSGTIAGKKVSGATFSEMQPQSSIGT